MKRNRFINLKAVSWMLLLVALLSACREDDAGTPQAQMRTISLNFPAIQPYTASRAEDDVNAITHESTFHTADIWVFNSTNTATDATAAAYKHIEDAERYTTSSGELRTELTIPEEITTVDIYVITNNSATADLDANSTRSELQAATFNSKPNNETSPELASNGLLMSRIIEDIPVNQLPGGYDANTQLPLERGVAKIACFFAKESESTQAEITGITVSGATDMGSVFPAAVTYGERTSRPDAANVPEGAGTVVDFSILPSALTVSAVLDEGETMERGENEYAQNYVDRLVNTIQADHTDDYYLFEADANEMQISIKYRIDNGEEKEAEPLVLDKDIVRNHYVVIVGTVQRTSVPVEDIELLFEIVSYENREISIPDFE